jgi:hypothetical protein
MSKATNHLTQKAKPTQDGTSVRGRVLWYPTQDKVRLEFGTQPSLPVKHFATDLWLPCHPFEAWHTA